MGGRGAGRLRSGGGYGGGGVGVAAGGGGGMSKRGGAAKRDGRFLLVEEEDRLRTNVLRRNSLNNQLSRNGDREEGSEMDATDILVQVVGNPAENDSALERVRRLEGGQGGSNQSLDHTVDMEARRDEFDFGRSMTLISEQLRRGVGQHCGEDKWSGNGCGEH